MSETLSQLVIFSVHINTQHIVPVFVAFAFIVVAIYSVILSPVLYLRSDIEYVYSPLRQRYKYRILKKYNTTIPTIPDRQDETEQILI